MIIYKPIYNNFYLDSYKNMKRKKGNSFHAMRFDADQLSLNVLNSKLLVYF